MSDSLRWILWLLIAIYLLLRFSKFHFNCIILLIRFGEIFLWCSKALIFLNMCMILHKVIFWKRCQHSNIIIKITCKKKQTFHTNPIFKDAFLPITFVKRPSVCLWLSSGPLISEFNLSSVICTLFLNLVPFKEVSKARLQEILSLM